MSMQEYIITEEEMRQSRLEKVKKLLIWWKTRWVEEKMSPLSLSLAIKQIKYLEHLVGIYEVRL